MSLDLSAAVEAAARAAFRYHCGPDADLDTRNALALTDDDDGAPEPYLTELWEGWMRAGLAAAAPLIEAAVWNAAADFVDAQRGEEFGDDLRQVRDRLRTIARIVRAVR